MKDKNRKMSKKFAAEEALCSLYRLEIKMKDKTPLDIINAIGALELLVLNDTSTRERINEFKSKLEIGEYV